MTALIDRNLRHCAQGAGTPDGSSTPEIDRLVRASRPWLAPLTQAVALAELDKISMRSMLPVVDSGLPIVLPPSQYDEDALLEELVEAFDDLKLNDTEVHPKANGSQSSAGRRLAAAALTAHARLANSSLRPLVVSLPPESIEEPAAVEAGVSAVLNWMPGEALAQLPFFWHCATEGTRLLLAGIKGAILDLLDHRVATKTAEKAAIKRAREGLYYLATTMLRDQAHQDRAKQVVLKRDRAGAIFKLLKSPVLDFEDAVAIEVMVRLGIWRADADHYERSPSQLDPNFENVLCARGLVQSYVEKARLWQAGGMLCPAIINATVKTKTQRKDVIQALVKEELLSPEAAAKLLGSISTNEAPWAACPAVTPTAPRLKHLSST
jgi:hypothetical protein